MLTQVSSDNTKADPDSMQSKHRIGLPRDQHEGDIDRRLVEHHIIISGKRGFKQQYHPNSRQDTWVDNWHQEYTKRTGRVFKDCNRPLGCVFCGTWRHDAISCPDTRNDVHEVGDVENGMDRGDRGPRELLLRGTTRHEGVSSI